MKKVLLAITLAALAGCSTEVQIHQLQGAAKFCEPHGGVSRMWSDLLTWHAQCVDGVRLYSAGEKK